MLRPRFESAYRRATGHFWTIACDLGHRIRPPFRALCEDVAIPVADPTIGPLELHGRLFEPLGAETLLVIVHGLGGDAQSPYCQRAAATASARGWASLRLELRGAGGHGEDLYHAGLASDLASAITHPRFAGFRRVVVLGYSLGGHLALRYALEPAPRVQAVAAVCAPLDLDRASRALDRPQAAVYRHVILAALKRSYRRFARNHDPPTPPAQVVRVRTIRRWDALAVVPRFRFASVDAYYREVSVAPHLPGIGVPTLYVGARHDPMVPWATIAAPLQRADRTVTVHMLDEGGHVGFPRVMLGGVRAPLEHHLLTWLDRAEG